MIVTALLIIDMQMSNLIVGEKHPWWIKHAFPLTGSLNIACVARILCCISIGWGVSRVLVYALI